MFRIDALRVARRKWRGIGRLAAKAAAGSVAGIIIGHTALWGAETARASAGQLTLHYSCSYPVIGSQPMTAVIDWRIPGTITAGSPVPPLPLTATAQVPSLVAVAARTVLGATSLDAWADVSVKVSATGGNSPVSVRLTSPRTSIPASGPMTDVGTGTFAFPSSSLSRPGNAKVTVGTVVMHLTPRNADGGLTHVGTVTSKCTLDPGQNNLVTSVLVNPARPAAKPEARPATVTPHPTSTKPKLKRPSPPPVRSAPVTPAPTIATHAPVPGPGGGDFVITGASGLAAAGVGGGLWWLLMR